MNGVGKPCAGERHARIERGLLGTVGECIGDTEIHQVTTRSRATVSHQYVQPLNQRPTSLDALRLEGLLERGHILAGVFIQWLHDDVLLFRSPPPSLSDRSAASWNPAMTWGLPHIFTDSA